MPIKEERLKQHFEQISAVGKTNKGGVERLALSDEDREGRELFWSWLTERNLDVRIDDLGNMYGIKQGRDSNRKPIVLGSHLDSVPKGGKYDGTIGVLGGLEVVETLLDEGISHDPPIIVVNFTNEEGARFPKPMISSGCLAGIFTTEQMYQLADDNGVTIKEELERIGYLGDPENRLHEVEAFLELHIEQGPVLEEKEKQIGVVEGIQGLSWYLASYYGEADHAGPSPMESRKDASIAMVKAMNSLYDWVKSLSDGTLVTFGKVRTEPNVVNVIPSVASFSIDIRHPDRETLERRVQEMRNILENMAQEEQLEYKVEDLSNMPPVQFSTRLTKEMKSICEERHTNYEKLFSGAGHDAMYMTHLGDTAMVFVPSINGKSHNEIEESRMEDIIEATNLLYELTKRLISSIEGGGS